MAILPTHASRVDFNGDGFTDLIWRGADGTLAVWNMSQDGLSGVPGTIVPNPDPQKNSYDLKGLGDFDGDGTSDLLRQSPDGLIFVWYFENNRIVDPGPLTIFGKGAPIVGVGDFNGDGRADLLWHHGPTGWNTEWLMDGARVAAFGASIANPGDFWTLGGV